MESSLYPSDIDNITTDVFNINVGILGHVDSGKTSLSKRLSTISSTAAFDKNPQSKERGITLDLGFSAFYIRTPDELKVKYSNNTKLMSSKYIQITLVDCPGHASLIKTIISGSAIIDTMILVIDSIKGIQVQTIECLILSEILCERIVVAFNKADLLKTNEEIDNKINKLRSAFKTTKYGVDIPIIPLCCDQSIDSTYGSSKSINELISNVIQCVNYDQLTKDEKEGFLMFIDHCFIIKNKGSIITGTIIKGGAKINDDIFFPELSAKKQIKEIQVFKKNVSSASKGDRVGMLIKNLDSQQIERSIACSEGQVSYSEGGLFLIKKVKLYKSDIHSNMKYYLMIGNQGINAKCTFFSYNPNNQGKVFSNYNINSIKSTNVLLKELYKEEFQSESEVQQNEDYCFGFCRFDSKSIIPNGMLFLGSKIDMDITQKTNRLAFYGKMIDTIANVEEKLKIFKMKCREGSILRIDNNTNCAIVNGLFKKDGNINDFIGKTVSISQSNGEIQGTIISTFGQTGKVKVDFKTDLSDLKLKDEENGEEIGYKEFKVKLYYKKYIKLAKIK